jgi:superfamily II DNA/RNA helicase
LIHARIIQGIDIPDIDLVVQYQLPHKYCILFQRVGRAARDHSRTAIVIIFVEAKYLDDTASLGQKQSTSRGKKRKVDKEGNLGPDPKKRRTSRQSDISSSQSEPNTKQEEPEQEDNLKVVATPSIPTSLAQPAKGNKDVEPVMDAFINAATRQSGCRRGPGNQFFANPEVPQGMCMMTCINPFLTLVSGAQHRGRRRFLLFPLLSTSASPRPML